MIGQSHNRDSVVVSPELFWPLSLQTDNLVEVPSWPNLVDVSGDYVEVTPTGD